MGTVLFPFLFKTSQSKTAVFLNKTFCPRFKSLFVCSVVVSVHFSSELIGKGSPIYINTFLAVYCCCTPHISTHAMHSCYG